MDLTKRQQEIFDFIKRYSEKNGYPPTVRDIGKAVGLASPSTVHAHLDNLQKLGLVRRDPTKPRAMELLDRAAAGVRDAIKPGLPLLGQVAAGTPIVAEENVEEHIETPPCAGGESGDYLLRVRGESMKKVGIMDGDLVVVKRQETARDGEIIVALVRGSETTLKRYYIEGTTVRLQPSNAEMEPIYVPLSQIAIQGRVLGVLRRYA